VAQDRALASKAESRDRQAAQAKARGSSYGRVGAGAEETKAGGGGPGAAKPTAGGYAPLQVAGLRGSHDDAAGSQLTDDELDGDDGHEGFYRASARAARELCSGSDACWWLGAEVLVADDLPTPAQKVLPPKGARTHF
jgi:hypothetical protein